MCFCIENLMCIGKEINNIADYFHYSEEGIKFFSDEKRYSAYYISKYLIEDTHGAILAHREKGFSENPFIAYIEFWGVMQAIYIQQDSISELYYSVTGDKHSTEKLKNWREIRRLRNACAGHPSRKDIPKGEPLTRTFMGRGFGDYSEFSYEEWKYPDKTSHPRVNLSELIQAYEHEAEEELNCIYQHMRKKFK